MQGIQHRQIALARNAADALRALGPQLIDDQLAAGTGNKLGHDLILNGRCGRGAQPTSKVTPWASGRLVP